MEETNNKYVYIYTKVWTVELEAVGCCNFNGQGACRNRKRGGISTVVWFWIYIEYLGRNMWDKVVFVSNKI